MDKSVLSNSTNSTSNFTLNNRSKYLEENITDEKEQVLSFHGESNKFVKECKKFMKNVQEYTFSVVNLRIDGMITQEEKKGCKAIMLVLGIILIIPLLFMFCRCWRRLTRPHYNIPLTSYKSLEILLKLPNLKKLSLTVLDNGINEKKISLLYEIVKKSRLRQFTFINSAECFDDSNKKEYSHFSKRMKPFKLLDMKTTIKWRQQQVA